MDMSPPTPTELDSYPHVFFTSDIELNPQSIVDEYSVHEMDLTENDLEHKSIILTLLMLMGSFSLLHVNMIFIFDINAGTTLTLNNCPLFLVLSLVFVSNTR
jgi:hypothetical protein